MKTYKIKGVQIFSQGKWNGDEYSEKDLDIMVQAFTETNMHVRPFLKLGHDDEQKLLQNDGLPAAGWVDNVYRSGGHILADFSDIPEKVYELIKRKAYRKVSCEIYLNCAIGDKKYKYLIGAVSLLGADTPGVMNLDDILAQYRLIDDESKKLYELNKNSGSIKLFHFNQETKTQEVNHMSKTERELELEAKLLEAEKREKAMKDKEAELLADKKKFEIEAQASAEKMFNLEVSKSVENLLAEKLITPSMKDIVTALVGREKQEYSVGDKKFTKIEMIKELCKLFAATSKVNLDENSIDGDKTKTSKTDVQDEVLSEVQKYADDNKVSFSKAYRIVAAKHQDKLKAKSMSEEH